MSTTYRSLRSANDLWRRSNLVFKTRLLQSLCSFAMTMLALSALTFSVRVEGSPDSIVKPIRVVATLSTFADLVKQIGGDRVEVSYIASPRFNPHFIEPKPSDVLKVKKADLFVHAGLDLEVSWRDPLLNAAGNLDVFPGQKGELDLSRGISLLEVPDRPLDRSMGDIHLFGNPHYWVGPQNGGVMARAIARKLSEIDPTHESMYQANLEQFLKRLEEKIAQWQNQLAPYRGKEVIGYHNEWPYLMEFAGLQMKHFLEPKPGVPPGPKQVGFLEKYMKERKIGLIIQSTFYARSASESLARRTGAQVVTLCQNVGELPEVKDYFSFMEYNVTQLVRALEEKTDG